MTNPKEEAGGQRLQKLLAGAALGSRRTIEQWIRAGRVTVRGAVAQLGDRASPGDVICVDGKVIALHAEAGAQQQLLIYHKPLGEVTTRSDPQNRPTVFEVLPPPPSGRWINVGRLDVNTSGLLLFTTDGELAHRLMHPSGEIEREYLLQLWDEPPNGALDQLRCGVRLEDGLAKFERLERDQRPSRHASNDGVEIPGGKADARTQHGDHLRPDHGARRNVRGRKEAAPAALIVQCLGRLQPFFSGADRTIDRPDPVDHRGERRRIRRESMVGPGLRRIKGEVFLDDGGTAGDRRDGNRAAECVIGEPDGNGKTGAQRVDHGQVHFVGPHRIADGTVQQRDPIVALGANHTDRVCDLIEARQAGGQQNGLPHPRDVTQERQVHEFVRRDLERQHPETVEKVGARLVERSREENEVEGLCVIAQPGQPFGRHLELLEHRVHGRTEPSERIGQRGNRMVRPRHERVRSERLKLDGVGATPCRALDQRMGRVLITVVIRSRLRNHEGLRATTDLAATDGEA